MTEAVIDKDKEEKKPEINEKKSAINMNANELSAAQTKEKEGKTNETEEEKTAREAKEEVERKEEVTMSKEDYDKLQKRIKDKDNFIDTLKKEKKYDVEKLQGKLKEQKEKLDEAWEVGGNEAAKAMKDVNNTETDLEAAKYDADIAVNKEEVTSKYEDFEDKIPEISKLLEKDGFSKKDITEFETSPYINAPIILNNLYERAVISLALQGKETELEKLKADNKTLKNNSKEFIDNIEKGSSRQTITAGSGGTGQAGTDLSKKSVTIMSREELRIAEKGE